MATIDTTARPAKPGEPLALITELADDLAVRGRAAAIHHDPTNDSLAPITGLLGVIDRLIAAVVTVLIGLEHGAVVASEGLTTSSWLRAVARRTGADAGMLLTAAERLADMPATLTAFQTGVLSWGTVRGIVTATRSLTGGQRTWVDTALTADADRLGRVDGDTVIADAHQLADRARPDLHADRADRADRAAAAQHLVLQPAIDGGGTLFAALDAESFAAVTAAIDGIARDGKGRRVTSNVDALRALARQRVTLTTDTDTDDAGADDDADGGGDGSADERGGGIVGDDGTDSSERDGDAPRRVRPAPSTARPEMIIVTDIRTLTDPTLDPAGSDVARLLWRHDRPAPRLTRHAARRLACDATLRAVLTDESGRTLGTAEPYAKTSTSLRTALAARDAGCRFPACHAPVEVCEAHHLRHRIDGGPTTLPNLALLCAAHHRAVHEGGWTPTLDAATGAMTFTRRGTTLRSHPRLPAAVDTGVAGPPPRGRPSRRRRPDPRPAAGPDAAALPDPPPGATPPATAPDAVVPRPLDPLPF